MATLAQNLTAILQAKRDLAARMTAIGLTAAATDPLNELIDKILLLAPGAPAAELTALHVELERRGITVPDGATLSQLIDLLEAHIPEFATALSLDVLPMPTISVTAVTALI